MLFRRPPARREGRRTTPALLSLLLVALLASTATMASGVVAPGTASADPIVPPGANDTVRALAEANSRAADAVEASLGAREQLAVRDRAAEAARADADAARVEADRAREEKDLAFVDVDRLTSATYQGGQLDPLSALLGSDSPGSYLDKISLLDTVSVETQAAVARFTEAATRTEDAERASAARLVDADRAASDARRIAVEADERRVQADRDVATAEAAMDDASDADRAALRSGGTTEFSPAVAGSGIAVDALRVALTRQGSPYIWGATGPGTFDCSGLVQWAYRQVGVGLPRVSRDQATVGQAVAPQQAQVGDLLFFNSPVTHVGIYVGNNQFLEAPQSGDVVKVSPVRRNLSGVRRIAL